MKKKFIAILSMVLATLMCVSITACKKKTEKLALGKEYIPFTSQLDAVMGLDRGDVDAVVIDSVMAGYYCTTGDYASKIQKIDNLVLAEEEYGIAAKKGNQALMSKINEALIAISQTDYLQIAEKFGLQNDLLVNNTTTNTYAGATDSSWTDVVNSGKITIGYTIFAPIAIDENNGFDIELAKKVIEYLNATCSVSIDVEFLIITWAQKEANLADGTIDLVWNGLTINEERLENMCISVPYLANKQVAVINKTDASKFTSIESLSKAILGAEKGSAGEEIIKGKA